MLSRLGRRSFPLALQLYERTSSMCRVCKPNLFATVSSAFCVKRTPVSPDKPALGAIPSILHPVRRIHVSASHMKRRKVPEEDEKWKQDYMRYNLGTLAETPKPALYMGLVCLVPFVAAPLAMFSFASYFPDVACAQMTYGACVLSFFGGMRWGFAMPENSPAKPDWLNLGNSVVPVVFAWLALFTCDSLMQSVVFVIMGLGIALHYDLALLPTYPMWLRILRTSFTVIAVASLVATLMFSSSYPHENLFTDTP